MLTYQPGKLLKQVPCTQELMVKVGEFTGQIDRVLKVSFTDVIPDGLHVGR
jgi:Ser/Thr protein kinase RdoA (MazF antagonist)